MPYILNKTNGSVLTTVYDGSVDQTTDLIFVGRNYAGYGEIVNENLLKLLENFSNATAPTKPISGQLWYDSTGKKLKVYDGRVFKSVAFSSTGTTAPSSLAIGDFWWNTSENKLYVKSGSSSLTLIGPGTSSTSTGTTSTNIGNTFILANVRDVSDADHPVVETYVDDQLVSIFSFDEFQVSTTATVYSNYQYLGNGINSSIYTRKISTGNVATTGTITGSWSLVGASTLEATYADLAERYAADKVYSKGTVLVIGGTREVTSTHKRADTSVAGIVSTAPAFKMNSDAGTDATHPYLALKGRVPCKVSGPIKKGDKLVTSDLEGHACAYQAGDHSSAIFATALEDFNEYSGTIEVKV